MVESRAEAPSFCYQGGSKHGLATTGIAECTLCLAVVAPLDFAPSGMQHCSPLKMRAMTCPPNTKQATVRNSHRGALNLSR